MSNDHCPSIGAVRRAVVIGATLLASAVFSACSPDVKSGCLINGDCAQGQQCISSKCVTPPKVCTGDADCAEGEICEQGLCKEDTHPMPTGCSSDEDCNATPQTPLCLSTKVCGECRSTVDCGDSKKQCSDGHTCIFTLGNCGSEADCSASSLANTPHCDTVNNACVGCVDSGQCASGYFCSQGTHNCQVEPTHHCTGDGDCTSATPHCESGTGLCRQCTMDNQCTTGKSCQNGSCVSGNGGCSIDGDCPDVAFPVCNATTGACVECVIDNQCAIVNGSHESCFNNTCVVLNGCTTSAQCNSNETCQSGQCVANAAQCTTDAQCASGETCDAFGDCVPAGSCSSSLDCTSAAQPWCDFSTGTCVECTINFDCGSGQTCVNNVCTGGSSGSGSCQGNSDCASSLVGTTCDSATGLCVQCNASTPCASGEWCEVGVCVTGVSQTCQSTSDCSATSARNVCDGSIDLCVDCVSNSDCSGGKQCLYGFCQYPSRSCSSNGACAGNPGGTRCYVYPGGGYCVQCTSSSQCPNNNSCIGHVCFPDADPFDCRTLIYCQNSCSDYDCLNFCAGEATATARTQNDALSECLNVACPDTNDGPCDSNSLFNDYPYSCRDCSSAAQNPGGDCYAQLAACRQD